MHHMTIRNVDPAVKAALEEAARMRGISQSEAARRALARGLGVRLPRRDLAGIGAAVLGGVDPDGAARGAMRAVDWTAPAFTEAELDAMEADGARRQA